MATSCRTSDAITAPTTASHTVDVQVPFTQVSGNKYEGSVPLGGQMAGQPFTFTVNGGTVDWVNTGAQQPIICDGTSRLGLVGLSLGNTGSGGGKSIPAGAVVAIIIVLLVLIVGGGWYYLHSGKTPPGTSTYGSAQMMAPPPPPGAPSLPAGWTELVDPNSGAKYFYNQSTGETTWTRPAGHV